MKNFILFFFLSVLAVITSCKKEVEYKPDGRLKGLEFSMLHTSPRTGTVVSTNKDYYRKEIRRGSFYRSVQLPTHVVGDKASAEYKNGILKINLPKAPESKVKSIKVNVK